MNTRPTIPTRKAVLIGSPGDPNTNFLSGVRHDLKNLQSFLKSSKGGAWHSNEITVLDNPSSRTLNQILQYSIADYLLVYFSGHGFTNSITNGRMICLEDKNIHDLNLLNHSPRQLVLIDACRNILSPGISGIPDLMPSPYSYFGGSSIRMLFDQQILNSPHGKLIIHGTQFGAYSYDSPTGGIFTNALLNAGSRMLASKHSTPALIQEVIQHIPYNLQLQGFTQFPSIAYKEGNLKVPFSIAIPKNPLPEQKRMPQRQVSHSSNNSGYGLLALVFGLLAVGLLSSNSK